MVTDFTAIAFTAEQIQACSMAMLQVAQADGIDPAELALIRAFWDAAIPSLGELPASASTFDASLFTDPSHKHTVLELVHACAFADGQYSSYEKSIVASIGHRLGFTDSEIAECASAVRSEFLGGLSHLPDSQAVADLAKGLE